MFRFAVCGFLLLFATSAMAQSVTEKTGVNSVAGIAPTTQDFVTEAAQSDMFELASSKMALSSVSSVVKTFAQTMIDDHTKTTADLKADVAKGTVHATLPTAMTSAQQGMIDTLKGLHGADFDKQYVSDQVSAHKTAVSLFQRYGKSGDNADLKAWAAKTTPALEHHLAMAQNLSK
jgi:putative membrane protein